MPCVIAQPVSGRGVDAGHGGRLLMGNMRGHSRETRRELYFIFVSLGHLKTRHFILKSFQCVALLRLQYLKVIVQHIFVF